MTITSLTQAARDPERVNIFVEGEFAMGIDKQTLAEFKLYQGKEIDQELLNKLLSFDSVTYLYRRMLDWWGKRPRSSREMRDKVFELIKKREEKQGQRVNPEEVFAAVQAKLDKYGYNDTAFADWFASERARQGKYGRQKVQSELQLKGVAREVISQVLDKYFENESVVAEKLLDKKYGVKNLKEIKDPKLKAKAYRFLASRGFRPT
jgi:regulatory protein